MKVNSLDELKLWHEYHKDKDVDLTCFKGSIENAVDFIFKGGIENISTKVALTSRQITPRIINKHLRPSFWNLNNVEKVFSIVQFVDYVCQNHEHTKESFIGSYLKVKDVVDISQRALREVFLSRDVEASSCVKIINMIMCLLSLCNSKEVEGLLAEKFIGPNNQPSIYCLDVLSRNIYSKPEYIIEFCALLNISKYHQYFLMNEVADTKVALIDVIVKNENYLYYLNQFICTGDLTVTNQVEIIKKNKTMLLEPFLLQHKIIVSKFSHDKEFDGKTFLSNVHYLWMLSCLNNDTGSFFLKIDDIITGGNNAKYLNNICDIVQGKIKFPLPVIFKGYITKAIDALAYLCVFSYSLILSDKEVFSTHLDKEKNILWTFSSNGVRGINLLYHPDIITLEARLSLIFNNNACRLISYDVTDVICDPVMHYCDLNDNLFVSILSEIINDGAYTKEVVSLCDEALLQSSVEESVVCMSLAKFSHDACQSVKDNGDIEKTVLGIYDFNLWLAHKVSDSNRLYVLLKYIKEALEIKVFHDYYRENNTLLLVEKTFFRAQDQSSFNSVLLKKNLTHKGKH